jgi:UDP-galactopyranose mutase
VNHYDLLVVGAGLAGATVAERAASLGRSVLVVDRRPHVAGNTFEELDDHGVRVHRYGPHIFHTNSEKVWRYLSRFTDWREYEHRVLADVDGQLLPFPINRTTINRLYGLDLSTDEEVAAFLADRAVRCDRVKTSEDAVVSKVGRDLYERFFRGYTRKMWGLDPSELSAQVCARIPVRLNDDDRYFADRYQAMPADGYTAMVKRMLRSSRIEVRTGTSFDDLRDGYRRDDYDHLVWTGPVDEFFGRHYGPLPYRSLSFEFQSVLVARQYQPVAVVNSPDADVPWTRRTEYRWLTGQPGDWTTLSTEYPSADGPPYYPIPRPENQELYVRYKCLADRRTDVTFVGRLARYQYLNMDQVVAQALQTFRTLEGRWL